jgi:YfiR/HmsC-like
MVFLIRRGSPLLPLLIVALLAVCQVRGSAQATLENDIKATFLYNFTKFVEWPSPPPGPSGPFRLCVVADPEFTRAVDRTVAGESVDGRPLERVEPQSVDDVRSCAILYVGAAHLTRAARLLAAARQLPVLTVGEGPQFLQQGGAIGFVLENNRVRFDISASAVQQSGLKASSKLLRVARSVEGAR